MKKKKKKVAAEGELKVLLMVSFIGPKKNLKSDSISSEGPTKEKTLDFAGPPNIIFH